MYIMWLYYYEIIKIALFSWQYYLNANNITDMLPMYY